MLIEAYAARMPERQSFSHATAAVIHGIPMPFALEESGTLHVSAIGGGIPRLPGVIGHHEGWDRQPIEKDGLRLSSPIDTWCELSTLLGIEDLVAAGDYLVTGDEPYSGTPPLVTMEELRLAVRTHGSRRGARRLRAALGRVRYGAMSRMETRTRLFLVDAGLPEPALNHKLFDAFGRTVAMLDLAFVAEKVALEYQSALHDSPQANRDDALRRERLEDLGWTVVYITIDDLRLRPEETLARIRARLRARGARL